MIGRRHAHRAPRHEPAARAATGSRPTRTWRSDRHRALAAVLVALPVALVVAVPRHARAEWVVGLEPTASMMIDDGPRFGPTLAASLGYSPDLYPLLLVPELAVAAAVFPGSELYGLGRAQLGLRVGVTASVEPAAYARLGYGFVLQDEGTSHGLAIDAGAVLEGRLSREFTLGGLLGYQGLVAGSGSHHGLSAGLRLGVWF